MKIRKFLKAFGFGETRCAHCMAPFFPDTKATLSSLLCPDCQKGFIPYGGIRCTLCGNPMSEIKFCFNSKYICQVCKSNPPPWQGIAFYGLYEGFLRELLLRLKFDGNIYLSRLFADLLLQASSCLPKPDCLTVIPQFPGQLLKRGYNQTYEIGKEFSRVSGFPIRKDFLLKTRATRPQEGLTSLERKQNLAGAFYGNRQVRGHTIWLIDDILTSGATCFEATTSLLQKGAKEVYLLFVARTPLTEYK